MTAESVNDKLYRVARNGYPTIASIEVTAQCNAQCGYCYVKDSAVKELSTEQLCRAIDKLSKSGIIHLHITGGEPFLRPDILDILSFAIDCGFFYCTLFSNGILLNEKHLDFIIRNKDFFIQMQMSVFSHIPEKNDAYFGVPGAFDAILRNALFLKNNGIGMALALSILDFNIDEIEETRNFFKNLDLPLLISTNKIVPGPRIKSHLSSSTTSSFFRKYLLSLPPDELDSHKKALKQSLESPGSESAELCFGRFDCVFINSQGDLAQCLAFRKMKLGSVFEDKSVHDILLASKDYHAICNRKRTDIEKCSSCKFHNFCTICLGAIHSESNSLDGINAPMCNYTQALYDLMSESA
jgi:radical SAM protein with 4Fe4S-binding SPASM domain